MTLDALQARHAVLVVDDEELIRSVFGRCSRPTHRITTIPPDVARVYAPP